MFSIGKVGSSGVLMRSVKVLHSPVELGKGTEWCGDVRLGVAKAVYRLDQFRKVKAKRSMVLKCFVKELLSGERN